MNRCLHHVGRDVHEIHSGGRPMMHQNSLGCGNSQTLASYTHMHRRKIHSDLHRGETSTRCLFPTVPGMGSMCMIRSKVSLILDRDAPMHEAYVAADDHLIHPVWPKVPGSWFVQWHGNTSGVYAGSGFSLPRVSSTPLPSQLVR